MIHPRVILKRMVRGLPATVVLVVVLTILTAEFGRLLFSVREPARRMHRTAVSLIGRPQGALVQALGPPRHVVRAATLAGRTVDYPWKEMHFIPVPTRPVRATVLLYSLSNMAIYVYVDEQGLVEHVAVAGT
jgi:hypothetical protein